MALLPFSNPLADKCEDQRVERYYMDTSMKVPTPTIPKRQTKVFENSCTLFKIHYMYHIDIEFEIDAKYKEIV